METVINRGYQVKIVPTAEQKTYFLQAFGCARKLYNHYVDTCHHHHGLQRHLLCVAVCAVYHPCRIENVRENSWLGLCPAG
ncbi:MAG: helix-turn-helix domain-containing protein [Clostridiales bacterium]|nr:helix-turn-helix domain-containing protein [Clostridiales bacterium]